MGCSKHVRMGINTQRDLPWALHNHREKTLYTPKDRNYLTNSIKYGGVSTPIFPEKQQCV